MGGSLFGGYIVRVAIACCDSGFRYRSFIARDEREALAMAVSLERFWRRHGDPGTSVSYRAATRNEMAKRRSLSVGQALKVSIEAAFSVS